MGTKINLEIWNTDTFKNACLQDRKIVLNPTLNTAKIIRHIMDKHNRSTVIGEKGSGKSFAYFIYQYLSEFILNIR